MSENVISLNGKPIGKNEVSKVCVDTLREMLQSAESGELTGVAVVGLHSNGEASYHIVGQVGGFSMVGALDIIKAELVDINRGYEE